MKNTSFTPPIQKGNITIYPALPPEILRASRGRKTQVAAYVRVSTDSVEQEGSLTLQKEYYDNLIKSNPEYELVGIYEDDGVSATTIEKRKGFQRLIDDCKAGKIDLVLTKSVSRFARNLGDLLNTINILNTLNPPVEVRFETDRISTIDQSGEIFISYLGQFAQMESKTKSESITWAIDNLFAQGKFYVPAIFGYTKEKGRDKPLIINEDEAKIVQLCFAMTLTGYSYDKIANTLNSLKIKSKFGSVNWTACRITSLLSNEKYAGELRARKTVTPNYKTHKSKKNDGEKARYYIEKHHHPIVPPLVFDVASKIMKIKKGNSDGVPYLKAIPKGVLKGFVSVNKNVRGYSLNDYTEASQAVCKDRDKNNSEISIFADKASIFDFRTFDTVSTLLFDDRQKPSCTIKDGKVTFNTACRKSLGKEKAELLFHPTKAILALRVPVTEKDLHSVITSKPLQLKSFVPIALESAKLISGYQFRIYGTKRAKNGECIMFFDLRNAKIIPSEKDGDILPEKYTKRYGDGYYENLAACDLHKIDFDGLWQALQKSKPADSLAGQIFELRQFCQKSFAECGLLEELTINK